MSLKARVVVGVVIGALALGGGAVALGGSSNSGLAHRQLGSAVAHGSCPTAKVEYVASDATGLTTTSTTPVNVPGMTRRFRVGGTHASCVVVGFSSYAFSPDPELEYVQAVMGSTVAAPGATQYTSDTASFAGAHQYTFVFPSVTPGRHRITIQFYSLSGTDVFIHHPVMTIWHA